MADKMKHYTSTKAVYTGGQFVPPGRPFVSDAKPSDDWEEISAKEAAIDEGATSAIPDDADLDALSKAGLQAVAFMRHVSGIKDLDNDGLKDAIRASYEPKL